MRFNIALLVAAIIVGLVNGDGGVNVAEKDASGRVDDVDVERRLYSMSMKPKAGKKGKKSKAEKDPMRHLEGYSTKSGKKGKKAKIV